AELPRQPRLSRQLSLGRSAAEASAWRRPVPNAENRCPSFSDSAPAIAPSVKQRSTASRPRLQRRKWSHGLGWNERRRSDGTQRHGVARRLRTICGGWKWTATSSLGGG